MPLTCKGDLDWGTSQRYTDTNGVVWHRVAQANGVALVHNNNGAARVLIHRHHKDPYPLVPAKEGAVEFARDVAVSLSCGIMMAGPLKRYVVKNGLWVQTVLKERI